MMWASASWTTRPVELYGTGQVWRTSRPSRRPPGPGSPPRPGRDLRHRRARVARWRTSAPGEAAGQPVSAAASSRSTTRSATSRTASSWLATMTCCRHGAGAEGGQNHLRVAGVLVAGRLVGQEDGRLGDDGAGDGQPLLLAERGLRGRPAGQRAEVEGVEHGGGSAGRAASRPVAGQAQHQLDVLGHRQLGQRAQHLRDDGGPVPPPPGASVGPHAPDPLDACRRPARTSRRGGRGACSSRCPTGPGP